jgi:zinc resistance-associated protein
MEIIMKKTIIIISSFLLVAFIAGNVLAWGPGSGRGMGWNSGQNSGQDCPRYGGQNGYNGQNNASNLSQEQTDELSALRQKFIDETYEIRSAKYAKQQEINMLMETSNPDRAKLSKLTKQASKLQNEMRDKQIDFQLAAKAIAPELNTGRGFGKNRSKGSNRGQGNCPQSQGQGGGCGRY